MPQTVISVPIYDRDPQAEYTLELIRQFQDFVTGDWLLVIVDNGSPSVITQEFLSYLDDPRIHIIHNETNRGYGTAANQGIAYGFDKGCEFGIVLNNDVIFNRHDWIEHSFVSHLREHPDWLMGARYLPDNGLTDFGTGMIPYLEGWCYAFGKALWLDLGGFDERFLAYFEDVDLCYRAVAKGYKLIPSPDFTWLPNGHLQSAICVAESIHHIGGRTGYANIHEFNYIQVTIDSARYFRNKWQLPKLPKAEWELN